ncbi:Hypothetical predicted protein [Olea europaea subsp. europaea]|uniref:Uncharacterized protein n=1 Tax=Olea europaea subsp. europaea TaxID=158383 RepID=A0A8S0PYA2_OLEEU|nr:Hypothetical predicted protein [Olea europaea subsp. europaea]
MNQPNCISMIMTMTMTMTMPPIKRTFTSALMVMTMTPIKPTFMSALYKYCKSRESNRTAIIKQLKVTEREANQLLKVLLARDLCRKVSMRLRLKRTCSGWSVLEDFT